MCSSKNVYYELLANELSDPNTSSKACCSIIKTLVNCKKVPVIPPILIKNKLVTNFKDKDNDFFSKQYQPTQNNSTLPLIKTFETSNRLSIVDIGSMKILKLIQGLNTSKAN